jgi:hypothetical protein
VDQVTCPECLSVYKQGSAFCGYCGTAITSEPPGERYQSSGQAGPYLLGASASQFPRTPGDQYIPSAETGQHAPPVSAPPREFRLDLRRLSRADLIVGGASLVVLVSLFLPWFGVGGLGANISVNGTTAHGYLVIAVVTALVMPAYLLLRSGWHEFPVAQPIAHEALLLAGTGLQFLLVLIGFLDVPLARLSWEIGAYLALLASVAAAVPMALPAVHAWQARR